MVGRIDITRLRRFLAPEVLLGIGAHAATGRLARGFSVRRALLVSDPGVEQAGWTGKVAQSLEDAGISTVQFLGVTSNPRDVEVVEGARVYREERCEMIVAVGGGSPMDAAKAVGCVVSNAGEVQAFEGIDAVEQPGPPLVCLPTTAGTSADVSQFAIITDTRRDVKMAIVSKAMVPDLSIIDPQTGTTMSRQLAADTGIDALVHAIEAYTSTTCSALTDLHALAAVRLIGAALPHSCHCRDDLQANEQMMQASLHAGLAFSNASLGAVHAMGHALGSHASCSHGQCVGRLLETVIRFNYPAAAARFDTLTSELTQAMGEAIPGTGVEALCTAIRQLQERALFYGESAADAASWNQIRATLPPIPAMAQQAIADPCMLTNPRCMTLEDMERLYELFLD